MFTRLAPQRTQHESGYIVQTGSRFSMEYIDAAGRKAIVQAEILDTPVTLFARQVKWEDGSVPSDDERIEIVERVRLGLIAMDEDAVIADR